MSRVPRPLAEGWALLVPLVALAVLLRRRGVWALAPAGLAAAIVAALRDPERRVLDEDGEALAPADGRVVEIATVFDERWQQDMLQIAIFLALWNVHVQRAPLAGRIVEIRAAGSGYRPALYASADANVRKAIYLETDWGPCTVTQISGLIARRIVQWVATGDVVTIGQRLGLIKFGSRVTVRLPLGTQPLVAVGQEVRAGLTPIARRAS